MVVDGDVGRWEIVSPLFQSVEEVCAFDSPGGFKGWVLAFLDLEGCDFFDEEEDSVVEAG